MAREETITAATNEHQLDRRCEYDVFLCFRGYDTRISFTGNLYNALRLKRFKVFMDEGGLKSGNQISLTFFKALEGSRISIVVLSKDFAHSAFCLDELVMILECGMTKGQRIFPIFYDVDPSTVRNQTGGYGEAMASHEKRIGEDSEKLQKWKSALRQVANLAGLDFRQGHRYEYELIQRIVEWVTETLPRFDVFLSFYGEDTGYSFTGYLYNALDREGFQPFMKGRRWEDRYLYNALDREGFQTFMEDKGWEDGDQSSQPLITATENSRLSIVVLSENYAHSPSRLDELVTILDLMKTKNLLVWPVFYKVEPSDIRHQRKSFEKAMTGHENKLGKDSEKVQTWRSALFEVANLKGWHLKFGYEYELIEKIVDAAIKI